MAINIKRLRISIPSFDGCKRCGQCCGQLKLHKAEWELIRKYLTQNDMWLKVVMNAKERLEHDEGISCFFLKYDSGMSSCMIYPQRPIICRIFGLKSSLQCRKSPNGTMQDSKELLRYYSEVSNNGGILNTLILNEMPNHLNK